MDASRLAGQDALRAIVREEQATIELENLEADHLVAEEAYLRRKDRLLGHEIPDVYQEIETGRSLLARAVRQRQERFEAMRVAVLTGRAAEPDGPTQLVLLPTL
jgi:transcriptional regulator of acetoin/glycerol metabolism